MQVKEVMTALPHTIGVDQSLQTARGMMHEYRVRHLPVQQGGKLIGIITDRDIHFALGIDKASPENMIVEDAYTADPYIVAPDENLKAVSSHMASEGIGCALIVENDKLTGIFTTVDACRTLSNLL